ncbi:MAG: hypothetical protein GF405_04560 [Candidatus Eisenbacteria bacterium]|nr:hypothetical protein [Candidatus Eisenbacteria bacterium]
MKLVRILSCGLLLTALVLGLAGCSDLFEEADEAEAEASFATGMDELMDEMEDVDTEEAPWEWEVDLSKAQSDFEDALDADSDHCGALFFSAFVRLLMVATDEDLGDIMDEGWEEERASREAPLLWMLDKPNVFAVADRIDRIRQDDPILFSEIQEFIESEVMPALAYADSRLTAFETQDCSFTIEVEIPERRETVQIEIDATDAYFIHAPLDGLESMFAMVVSYNMDVEAGETQYHLIEEDEDFLTLRNDDHMATAYDKMVDMSEHLLDGCDELEAETDDQTNDLITETLGLIPLDDMMGAGAVDSIRFYAGEMQDWLIYGVTFNPSEDTDDVAAPDIDVYFDVAEFFNDPLDDLRDYFPYHTWEGDSVMVVTEPIAFPDPSFSNVTPNMTNNDWQQIYDWMEVRR